MKLITKVKEYYDYLQGIYGIDELVVYDRRTDNLIQPFIPESANVAAVKRDIPLMPGQYDTLTFAICNKVYTVKMYDYQFYHTPEELLKLNQLLRSGKSPLYKDRILMVEGKSSWSSKPVETIEDANKYYAEHNGWSTGVNKALRQPVLIKVGSLGTSKSLTYNGAEFGRWDRPEETNWAIPYLTKYGFGSWYPAEEIWNDIYSFIGWLKDNPEIPNKQTDLEKLQAHGFDKKVSFRHRKN